MDLNHKNQHILVAGDHPTAFSLCVCLLQAGHLVTLLCTSKADALKKINLHISDSNKNEGRLITTGNLNITSIIGNAVAFDIAIAITAENIVVKEALIRELESKLPDDTLIAINTESFTLSALQQHAQHPERLIGANWTEPAHTTFFLEIITNSFTDIKLAHQFYQTAKLCWQKDPYILKRNRGIRSKMMMALMREAFYLIENEYVTIEDIDRACRNDAGYYLPFAGNFRYMDLMGTYMYGIVMQDLNPELSKDTHIPQFCLDIVYQAEKGMKTGKGFYDYTPEEAAGWEAAFRKFSYQIREIISKYPFNHQPKTKAVIPVVLP
ncbi:3-hydroxyacyl-CoA dehydrogenase NAD-binding domain-containing protein [Mucilaginibacter sp.]|uniref:3-hydroxyacyl-CoA dehydrogenase NAD-binding domain-containing protein n=1 Tax=Mucilaginibacter sp. TaxID=1882438 RepID=UPI003B006766